MSKMTIRGNEYAIKKVFSDDFHFTVPLYQRAYSWTNEESEELLQDLLEALDSDAESVEELAPYFLGSVVLNKGEESASQIIDGQQRLTTLTMLLSALRSLSESQYADSLTTFICEQGNIVTGTPRRYRLKLRERDAKFFQEYIQDEGGIEKLKETQESLLSPSQRNIRNNTLGFVRELKSFPPDKITKLTQFIVNRCFLIIVAVSTEDLDSAYRVFSVLNDRGLNLSYPDILKAKIINAISANQQEEYTTKWEEVESNMADRDAFEDLFFNLRAIYSRKRLRTGFIEEFNEYVFPGRTSDLTPQQFIDDILVHYAQAMNQIVKANYPSAFRGSEEINKIFKKLNQLDFGKWMPPALYYFFHNWRQADLMLRFLNALERLVVSFVVCRVPPYRRIDRYCELLQAMYDKKDLYASDSPLQLKTRERQEFLKRLDGDIYQILPVPMCRYILLRLDEKLSESKFSYEYETVTVEHVLPQRPGFDSEWYKLFPSREIQDKYVNRLGNLVLLSRGKNMEAQNYDFDRKKRKYFMTNGISPFPLTTQVLNYQEWTPTVIEQRQRELVGTLRSLWAL